MKHRDDDRTLDAEGIPDLEAPAPGKVATGDPQEGIAPPNDRPNSFEHGVTAAEIDDAPPPPLDERDTARHGIVLVDDADSVGNDLEKDLIADTADDEPSLSAEEAAIHEVDDAPGGVDGPDSYLAERADDRSRPKS
jgi:hypothetical protein